LFQSKKKAEGIQAIFEAQSDGIESLGEAFQNNGKIILQYLMLDKGLYKDLSKINSDAIKKLDPKITVWNTGNSKANAMQPIHDIFDAIPPLLSNIQRQTSI
jgi:flotillin